MKLISSHHGLIRDITLNHTRITVYPKINIPVIALLNIKKKEKEENRNNSSKKEVNILSCIY